MTEKLKQVNEEKPWYADGLRFKCTGCGQCCTGSPGYIWVNEEEMQAIAQFLDLPLDQFTRRYLKKVHQQYSLIEYSKNYDCVFLKDKKCSIYPVRPKQCRTYPWWIQNLKSPEAWAEAAKQCDGISSEAPLVSFEEIQKNVQ